MAGGSEDQRNIVIFRELTAIIDAKVAENGRHELSRVSRLLYFSSATSSNAAYEYRLKGNGLG